MSLKSLLPAAAAVAVATLALAGCSMTTNVSGGDSSAPTSSSSEGTDHSGHDHSDKSDSSDKSDAKTYTIEVSNAHVDIPEGTTNVVVNGSNNHIEGDDVTEIMINGSANAVEVDSAKTVSFTGSNNAVQYKDGAAPQVASDSGANNAVTKG
jgi:hypothetical protein